EAETKRVRALSLKKCFDLMIIMDDIKGEKVDSNPPAVGNELIEALTQRSFPIIVSTNLVYNMCINRPDIELHDDTWYCYDHPEANIMLFIPKNYILNFYIGSVEKDTDAYIALSGFNTAHLKKINSSSN